MSLCNGSQIMLFSKYLCISLSNMYRVLQLYSKVEGILEYVSLVVLRLLMLLFWKNKYNCALLFTDVLMFLQ